MKKHEKSTKKRFHSNVFLKTLAAKLPKTSNKKLQEHSIVLSPRFQDISEVEVQFLLDNLISIEDLKKIRQLEDSFTSLGSYGKPSQRVKPDKREALQKGSQRNEGEKESLLELPRNELPRNELSRREFQENEFQRNQFQENELQRNEFQENEFHRNEFLNVKNENSVVFLKKFTKSYDDWKSSEDSTKSDEDKKSFGDSKKAYRKSYNSTQLYDSTKRGGSINLHHTTPPIPGYDSTQSFRNQVDTYLKKCKEDTYLKRFSSNSVLVKDEATQMSLENVRNIERCEKSIQEQKSLISLKVKKNKEQGCEKHRSTMRRLQRKMELMRKFCPEIYFSEESVISMWTRGVSALKYN